MTGPERDVPPDVAVQMIADKLEAVADRFDRIREDVWRQLIEEYEGDEHGHS